MLQVHHLSFQLVLHDVDQGQFIGQLLDQERSEQLTPHCPPNPTHTSAHTPDPLSGGTASTWNTHSSCHEVPSYRLLRLKTFIYIYTFLPYMERPYKLRAVLVFPVGSTIRVKLVSTGQDF